MIGICVYDSLAVEAYKLLSSCDFCHLTPCSIPFYPSLFTFHVSLWALHRQYKSITLCNHQWLWFCVFYQQHIYTRSTEQHCLSGHFCYVMRVWNLRVKLIALSCVFGLKIHIPKYIYLNFNFRNTSFKLVLYCTVLCVWLWWCRCIFNSYELKQHHRRYRRQFICEDVVLPNGSDGISMEFAEQQQHNSIVKIKIS